MSFVGYRNRSRSPVDVSHRGDSSFSRSPELPPPPGLMKSPSPPGMYTATGHGHGRRGSLMPGALSNTHTGLGHHHGNGGHFHRQSTSSRTTPHFSMPPQRHVNTFTNPSTPSHRSGRSSSSNRSDSPSLSRPVPPINYGPPSMFLSHSQMMHGNGGGGHDTYPHSLAATPHSQTSTSTRRSLSRRLENLSRADIHSDNRSDASISSTRLKIRMSHRRADYNPSGGPFSVYPPPSEPSMSRSYTCDSNATAPHSPVRRPKKRHHRVPSNGSNGDRMVSTPQPIDGFESDVDLSGFMHTVSSGDMGVILS